MKRRGTRPKVFCARSIEDADSLTPDPRPLSTALILLIDNYDSFVFNLARYFERLGQRTTVVRNDAIDAAAVSALKPSAIVLSPGPCTPTEAGCSLDLVKQFKSELPILGVCLGHQIIAQALGGRIVRAREPVHGRSSWVRHSDRTLFSGLANPFSAARYHSLVVEPDSLPTELSVTATLDDGTIMAIEHREFPVLGVQFHPESVLTEDGHLLLANFLKSAGCHATMRLDALQGEVSPRQTAYAPPRQPVTF
jgi:anthranilate synthase/aminodeoxychorismate synthase-like glutamine amidotransferase